MTNETDRPAIGHAAPDFSAPATLEPAFTLTSRRGRWLVLYFYPKDDTPGCTTEACQIRDSFTDLQKLAQVVGVSADSSDSHQRFAAKYQLPFTLLADPERQIIDAYGTDGIIMAKRSTFLIDPNGRVAKIYAKVTPDGHAAALIADLKALGTE